MKPTLNANKTGQNMIEKMVVAVKACLKKHPDKKPFPFQTTTVINHQYKLCFIHFFYFIHGADGRTYAT